MDRTDSARALLERVAATEAQLAVLTATRLRQVAAFAVSTGAAGAELPAGDDLGAGEPTVVSDGLDAAAAELAPRLRMTVGSAYRLILLALALTTRLPLTFAALAEGRIDQARAKVVADETEQLSDAGAAVVDEVVAGDLHTLNRAELVERLRSEVGQIDQEAVRARARKATAERCSRLRDLGDGIAELSFVGPATDLVPTYQKLDALARDRSRPRARVDPHAAFVHDGQVPVGRDGAPLDRRGTDARRYDAGVELLRQRLADAPAVGDGCGPQLMITLAAALGLDDEPAQLAGHGAIPAAMARVLLADHRFRRVLVDSFDGHLVAVDGHTYPPGSLPTPQVAAAIARARLSGEGEDPDAGGGSRRDLDPGGDGSPGGREGAAAPVAARTLERQPTHAAPGHACPVAAAGGGRYDVAVALQRFVRVRSRRCTAPGCRVPSRRCDLDHRVPWPQGPTCPCNLAPLCRRHHLAKHRFGWTVTKASSDPADPSQRWRSPLDCEYVVAADPVMPPTGARVLATRRGVDPGTWVGARVDPRHPYPQVDLHGRASSRVVDRLTASATGRGAHLSAPQARAGPGVDPPPF